MFSPRFAALIAAIVVASAGSARADGLSSVAFLGTTGSGSQQVTFSGNMSVTIAGGGTVATIQITLNNSTPASATGAGAYGYITGFGFNIPTTQQGKIGTVAGSSSDSDFRLLRATTDTTSLQAGEFDYAFSTDSTSPYQLHTVGSGDISKGLGAGQSATFTVTLTAAAGQTFTDSQLEAIDLLTDTSTYNGGGARFSARFRSTYTNTLYGGYQGNNDPDGDKVPVSAWTVPPVVVDGAVPAPPGVVLAGVGLACCLLGRVRRKTGLAQ